MDMKDQERWPLDGICLTTIFRVVNFVVDRHSGQNPWQQIEINGFVLSSQGDVTFASMMFGTDYDDMDTVTTFESKFSLGSLHWLKNVFFHLSGRDFRFLYPETSTVSDEDRDEIGKFFPVEIPSQTEISGLYVEGRFLYCGRFFKPGRGQFFRKSL